MKTLTIKEIAPYLPYGLKVITNKGRELLTLQSLSLYKSGNFQIQCTASNNGELRYPRQFKLLLLPLYKLTEEIEYDGNKDKAINFISTSKVDTHRSIELLDQLLWVRLEAWKIERLSEMHFDYMHLIPQGLAIDKSTTG